MKFLHIKNKFTPAIILLVFMALQPVELKKGRQIIPFYKPQVSDVFISRLLICKMSLMNIRFKIQQKL